MNQRQLDKLNYAQGPVNSWAEEKTVLMTPRFNRQLMLDDEPPRGWMLPVGVGLWALALSVLAFAIAVWG